MVDEVRIRMLPHEEKFQKELDRRLRELAPDLCKRCIECAKEKANNGGRNVSFTVGHYKPEISPYDFNETNKEWCNLSDEERIYIKEQVVKEVVSLLRGEGFSANCEVVTGYLGKGYWNINIHW